MFFRSIIVFSWIYKFISSSIFCNSSTWFFITSSKKLLRSLYFIFFGILSRIFLAWVIFSTNYKFIRSFFIRFFSVFIFNNFIYFIFCFISSGTIYFLSVEFSSEFYNGSNFLYNKISVVFFFISKIFIAFYSSISINARLNYIRS